MKKMNVVLLWSLILPSLAWSADVTMSLAHQANNTLKIDFVVDDSDTESVWVQYNVMYSGDNYPKPTGLFLQSSSIGSTSGMKGSTAIEEDFVFQEWIPAICKNVQNPQIWVEYSVNGGKTRRSNSIDPRAVCAQLGLEVRP